MEDGLVHSEANGGARSHSGRGGGTTGSCTSVAADVDGGGADRGVGVVVAADILVLASAAT